MARTYMTAEEYQTRWENFMEKAVAADPSLADPDAMERYLATVQPRDMLGLKASAAAAKLRTLGRYVPFGKPKTLQG